MGAEVPLQVADPQHHFGDPGGAGVDLEAEKLVRVDGDAFELEQALRLAEVVQEVEHFAFEALHVFERDVQEVAAAAGRVEHAQGAQVAVKGADLGDRVFVFALLFEGERGHLNLAPFGAQGLDDGGQHEALDVGARGVVGAELVALARVEGAFEQGAEDGGFDVAPVGAGGFAQQGDLVAVKRDGGGLGKQAAVEAQHVAAHDGREAAAVHGLPQALDHGGEGVRAVGEAVEQLGKGALGEQADVFGKHGEQRAHEKAGDMLGGVAGGFERFGEAGEAVGDVAGDAGGAARGVEAERVEPDGAQARADVVAAQVGQADAVAARVGVGGVVAAGAGELGVELDAVPDVGDQDEGRAAFGGGQRAGVTLCLVEGFLNGGVETFGFDRFVGSFGLADEGIAPIEIDEVLGGRAAELFAVDDALEHIGVVAPVTRCRLGAR